MKNLLLFLLLLLVACNNETESQSENMSEKMYSQSEIKAMVFPSLKEKGITYKKYKAVLARKAVVDEQIQTLTSDGLETTNIAKAGDFIVKNQTEAGEEYIVNAEKFHDRYELKDTIQGAFSIYKPKGRVIALEITTDILTELNLPDSFYFIAPWDEKMIVKKDDFLVSSPDYSEIYRIARKEFFETYQKD